MFNEFKNIFYETFLIKSEVQKIDWFHMILPTNNIFHSISLAKKNLSRISRD